MYSRSHQRRQNRVTFLLALLTLSVNDPLPNMHTCYSCNHVDVSFIFQKSANHNLLNFVMEACNAKSQACMLLPRKLQEEQQVEWNRNKQ